MKKGAKGVSLIEILVATAIVVATTLAIIETFLVNLNASEMNKGNTIAMAHVTNMMERIKCTPFNNLINRFPNGVSDGPVGNSYADVVGGYVLNNEHIVVTYVNPAGDPLEIAVTLTWRYANNIDRSSCLVTKRAR
jgi:Tfp pilus assembly protein PilV